MIILLWKNEHQQAFDLIDESTRRYSGDMNRNFVELLLFARSAFRREKDRTMATLSDGCKHYLWVDPVLPWLTAGFYAVMDEKDEAFRWLEHAIDLGWFNYPLLAEQDPFLENIRGDKRFQELMDRIKPQWEQFEIGIDVSGLPPVGDE